MAAIPAFRHTSDQQSALWCQRNNTNKKTVVLQPCRNRHLFSSKQAITSRWGTPCPGTREISRTIPNCSICGKKSYGAPKFVQDARLKGSLEADVVSCLVEGQKTITEMVENIFQIRINNPEFNTYYMRVWRATQDLEYKGYVARSLFGRQRPYRVTPLCVEKLFSGRSIGPGGLVAWITFVMMMLSMYFPFLRISLGTRPVSLKPSFS